MQKETILISDFKSRGLVPNLCDIKYINKHGFQSTVEGVVITGLVKNRITFSMVVEDGDQDIIKSYDINLETAELLSIQFRREAINIQETKTNVA